VRTVQAANKATLLIDVLANQHPQTIDTAHYLAQAGAPGTFKDPVQAQLAGSLLALTNNRKNVPLVFFCAGAQCWESYNAALRAHALGYTDIRWYRGGLASWAEARLPMRATPQPEDAVPAQ
jgi:PQQ-dependent catabolism-associated CXXCW motif protein